MHALHISLRVTVLWHVVIMLSLKAVSNVQFFYRIVAITLMMRVLSICYAYTT